MSELVRFGVAMDRGLLEAFDRRILARGYENRSEALRDLVRADLTRAGWDAGTVSVATMSVVASPAARDLVMRLVDDDPAVEANGTLALRIGRDRHLLVIVVKGRGADLTALAGRIGSARGVLGLELLPVSSVDPTSTDPSSAPQTP